MLESGGRIVQETRRWDEKTGTTYSLRSKEEAQDYRYFPEPDLDPLLLDEAFVHGIRASMPELPRAKRERFVAELGITAYAALVLTQHPRIAAFFEEAATLHRDPVRVANFVQSEVLRDVTVRGLTADLPITPRQLEGLLALVAKGAISGKQAKDVYARLARTDKEATAIVRELGMEQMSDASAIEAICARVIAQNPKQADQVRAGKASLLGFFVGLVMKETKGSANPAMVNDALRTLLA